MTIVSLWLVAKSFNELFKIHHYCTLLHCYRTTKFAQLSKYSVSKVKVNDLIALGMALKAC